MKWKLPLWYMKLYNLLFGNVCVLQACLPEVHQRLNLLLPVVLAYNKVWYRRQGSNCGQNRSTHAKRGKKEVRPSRLWLWSLKCTCAVIVAPWIVMWCAGDSQLKLHRNLKIWHSPRFFSKYQKNKLGDCCWLDWTGSLLPLASPVPSFVTSSPSEAWRDSERVTIIFEHIGTF